MFLGVTVLICILSLVVLNNEGDKDLKFEEISFSEHMIAACPWHLDTKYYEADIHFYEANERNLIDQEFADSIEAVIVYFDNDNVSLSILISRLQISHQTCRSWTALSMQNRGFRT